MIIDAFKNKILPKHLLVLKLMILWPDNPDSSFSTTDKSKQYCKSDEFDFTADDLDKMYIGNADDFDKLLLDTDKYLDPNLIKKDFLEWSLKKYVIPKK